MRSPSPLLTGLLILQLLFLLPAYAESDLASCLGAYNAHNYQKAAQYGEKAIQKQPGNAEARYYLANSYVQLKLMELAEIQYKRCIELAPDSKLAQNSRQALNSISSYLKGPATAASGAKKHGKKSKKHTTATSPEEESILKEAQTRIEMKERDANQQIANIRLQSKQDLAVIPKKIRHRSRNPAYTSAKADINAQTDEKINKIKRAMANDKRDILNDADQRISGLRK